MRSFKAHRMTVALVIAVAIVVTAGGISTASNMGFKLNKGVVFTGAGQIGANWVSIPYNNPYGNAGQFCSQTGLISTGINTALRGQVTALNEVTGVASTGICGQASANNLTLIPGKGIQVKQATTTGAPTNLIIVGSHNPTTSVTVPRRGSAQIGAFWFSVPYHTTAVTANDLCISAGLTSTGLSGRASVIRLNAATGIATTGVCGQSSATGLTLVLGEFVQLNEPGGPTGAGAPKTFIPAHF